MTMHRDGRLVCHYCGRSKSPVNICPSCGSPYISAFRAGTQQIEELLHKEFPDARILRMDMDTTRHKNDHEQIIRTFSEHQADILIGTHRILSKDVKFKDLGLLVVDFDKAIENGFIDMTEKLLKIIPDGNQGTDEIYDDEE